MSLVERFLLKIFLLSGLIFGIFSNRPLSFAADPQYVRDILRIQSQSRRYCGPPVVIPEVWTLKQAVDRALEANPELLVSIQELERQTGIQIQVASKLLPRITLQAQGTSMDSGLIDTNPKELSLPQPDQTGQARQRYDISIDFRQLVFDGFSSIYRTRSQYLMKVGAYWNVVDKTYQIVSSVRQSYDSILMRQSIIKSLQESVDAFQKLAYMIGKRYEVGDLTKLDSLRVEAELKNSQSKLAESQADLKTAEEQFLTLLQIPLCSADSGFKLKLEGPLEEQGLTVSLDDALCKAVSCQPSLKAAKAQTESSVAQLNAINGTYMPRIEFFARSEVKSSFYSLDQRLSGWTLGVMGSWDLFDGFERFGSRKMGLADLRASMIREDAKEYEIVSQVRELFSRIDALQLSVDTQENVVALRTREVSETLKYFNNGLVPFKDVLEAQTQLLNSQIELSLVVTRTNASIYQFEYFLGSMPVIEDKKTLPEIKQPQQPLVSTVKSSTKP